ncbi:MAG TPA: hypothetical protein GXZ82_05635 [Firmicutes bacterium]|nr:hypothetical protein [Bacillota bacterium]
MGLIRLTYEPPPREEVAALDAVPPYILYLLSQHGMLTTKDLYDLAKQRFPDRLVTIDHIAQVCDLPMQKPLCCRAEELYVPKSQAKTSWVMPREWRI